MKFHIVMKDPKTLKFLEGNRVVDIPHMNAIKEAMSQQNLLGCSIIILNEKDEIIDGQHRVMGAMQLGLKEVPCIVVPGTDLQTAQDLNQHHMNWTGGNFAKSYASQGRKDYQILIDFMDKYTLPCAIAMKLLSGGSSLSGSGSMLRNFRAGTFKVRSLDDADRFMVMLDGFKALAPKFYRTRSFMHAFLLISKVKGYSHRQMLHKCQVRSLVKQADTDNYVAHFEKLYNFAEPVAKRLRFVKL